VDALTGLEVWVATDPLTGTQLYVDFAAEGSEAAIHIAHESSLKMFTLLIEQMPTYDNKYSWQKPFGNSSSASSGVAISSLFWLMIIDGFYCNKGIVSFLAYWLSLELRHVCMGAEVSS